MKKNYSLKLSFLAFILPIFLFASNFTQTLTSTPEQCAGNGAIQVSIENANPNISQFTFRILTGTTGNIVATTTPMTPHTLTADATGLVNVTFLGLVAGNYRLQTVEIDGSSSKTTTVPFVVANEKRTLRVAAVLDNCTFRKVTASITSPSYGPYTYKILNSSSQVISQSSPTTQTTYSFPDTLANGSYNITVTDACGSVHVAGIVVNPPTITYDLFNTIRRNTTLTACNTKEMNLGLRYLSNGNSIAMPAQRYPVTVKFTLINYPGEEYSTVLNNSTEASNFKVTLPFHKGGNNSYRLTVTDSCGLTFTRDYTDPGFYGLNSPYFDFGLQPIANTCNAQFNLVISRIEAFFPGATGYKVTLTSTVPNFNANQYNSNFGSDGIAYFSNYSDITLPGVPPGSYTVTISDECGSTFTRTVSVNQPQWTFQKRNEWGSCTPGASTVAFMVTSGPNNITKFTSFRIVSAPQEFMQLYSTTLPYNADSWIYGGSFTANQGMVFANALPAGNYTFEYTTQCQTGVQTATYTTAGTIMQNYRTTKTFTCTSVYLQSTITSNYNTPILYLQKFDEATGKWGHPSQPNLYNEGTEIAGTNTALPLTNNPGNIGDGIKTMSSSGDIIVNTSGRYRVILEHRAWLNGIDDGFPIIATRPYQACQQVMEEFDINVSEITINNFIVTNCGTTHDLLIDAVGVNLSYTLIEKDGVPLSNAPQTSPLFTGLQPGRHSIRINDTCGREEVFTVYVSDIEKNPVITGSSFCEGQTGKLYVQGFGYLHYTWYKDGVAIPGATGDGYSALEFDSFNSATDAGIYTVNITYPGSCLDETLTYTIKPNGIAPEAGVGQTVTLDINNVTGPINLFDYLTGYDNSGVWSEAVSTGLLSDYIWDATAANAGTYNFTYTVNATCSGAADTATVTIILKGVCYKPANTGTGAEPTALGVTSLGRASAGDSNWPGIRKGGHIALESKTKGFVINRVAFDSSNNPVGIASANWVDGMAVYDTTNNCMKIYVDYGAGDSRNGWKCFTQPSCN